MSEPRDVLEDRLRWVEGLVLIHEDTVIRPAAMSHVKPSEYRLYAEALLRDLHAEVVQLRAAAATRELTQQAQALGLYDLPVVLPHDDLSDLNPYSLTVDQLLSWGRAMQAAYPVAPAVPTLPSEPAITTMTTATDTTDATGTITATPAIDHPPYKERFFLTDSPDDTTVVMADVPGDNDYSGYASFRIIEDGHAVTVNVSLPYDPGYDDPTCSVVTVQRLITALQKFHDTCVAETARRDAAAAADAADVTDAVASKEYGERLF